MEKKAGTGKKLLSVLLAAAVLLTSQGIPAFAESGGSPQEGREALDGMSGTWKNPVYDAWSDTTEWSYINFGSYPQSEVLDSGMIDRISDAEYEYAEDSWEIADAWVDGIRYRRVSQESESGYGTEYHYYKWEPIKWRVMEYDSGNDILSLVADQGLDCQAYSSATNPWQSSSLRSWLNGTFYSLAFDRSERDSIIQRQVENSGNPYQGIGYSEDTLDNVYLLSMQEIETPEYGYCSDYSQQSLSRQWKVSEYAKAMGSYTSSQAGIEGNCWWWLRSPGKENGNVARVYQNGQIDTIGNSVSSDSGTVVPALQLSTKETGSSRNPKYNAGIDDTEWKYIEFGSYPQTEVDLESDITLADELENGIYDGSGNITIDGVKYNRVQTAVAYHYYKWEPIKWKVLKDDGSTLLVIANQALDSQLYHNEYASVTWEGSSLRGWLNETFYNTAFDSREQGSMIPQNLGNTEYAGSGIMDNVCLLSLEEVIKPAYGFCDDALKESFSRKFRVTDYAYRMGVGTDGGNRIAQWLLRSDKADCSVPYVSIYGEADLMASVNSSDFGVVPVIQLDIESDCWTDANEDVEDEAKPLEVAINEGFQVNEGDTVTFSVEASGGHPSGYTYQWYYAPTVDGEGRKLEGETSSSYTIYRVGRDHVEADIQEEDFASGNVTGDVAPGSTIGKGYYYCLVISGKYQVESPRAILELVSGEGDAEGEVTPTPTPTSFPDKPTATPTPTPMPTPSPGGSGGNTGTWGVPGTTTGVSVITLNKASLSLKEGAIGELTATVRPTSFASQVAWKTSNSKVATVVKNGNKATVKAVKAGTTTITASVGGKQATCTVKVTEPNLSTPKVKVKLSSANAVKITWNKVKGAAGYYIYRTTNGRTFKKIKSVKGLSYTDKKIKSGTKYGYRVAAYKGKKISSMSAKKWMAAPAKPSTPKMKLDRHNAEQKFTISWNKVKNAQKIEIWRKVDRKGKYRKWKTVSANKRKATYSYKNYTRGHNYFYQIRAYYTKNNVKIYSGYSKGLGIVL